MKKKSQPGSTGGRATRSSAVSSPPELVEEVVVPVIEETAEISKRAVDRGSVVISKVVSEHEEVIDTSIEQEQIEIEHVSRDVWLDAPAVPRQEGDTLIIPVMEEVLVVEKRILLREELHVTKRKVTVPKQESVRLRREDVRVDDKRRR